MIPKEKPAIDVLAALAHPRDGRPRSFAMIELYLDDSGTHLNGSPLAVAAGYVAEQGSWREFEAEWRETLLRFAVPLERFHAKDIYPHPKGWFKAEWKQAARCWEFCDALASIMESRPDIHPVSVAVLVADFMSFNKDMRRWLTGADISKGILRSAGSPAQAFFYALIECLKLAAKISPEGEIVHPSFGLGNPLSAYALELIGQMVSGVRKGRDFRWEEIIGTPQFPRAAATPQLQAADLLAYSLYRSGCAAIREGASEKLLCSVPPPVLVSKLTKNSRCGPPYLLGKDAIFLAYETVRRRSGKAAAKL